MPREPDRWAIVLWMFAAANIGNAVWMLAAPENWYYNLPGGVPDTGAMNEHFIRDIGCIFLLMGIGLSVAAIRRSMRAWVLFTVTAWYAAHSLVHVIDTLTGRLSAEHWIIDVPGTYGPTLILIIISIAITRE